MNWQAALEQYGAWLLGISVVTFVASLVLLPWLIIRLPADHFVRHEKPQQRHPVVHYTLLVVKNALGIVLLIAGVVMSITPGARRWQGSWWGSAEYPFPANAPAAQDCIAVHCAADPQQTFALLAGWPPLWWTTTMRMIQRSPQALGSPSHLGRITASIRISDLVRGQAAR